MLDFCLSANDHNRTLCHSDPGQALSIDFGKEFPERKTFCLWTFTAHNRKADLFGSTEVTLHERRIVFGKKWIIFGHDIPKPYISEMQRQLGRPTREYLVESVMDDR